MRTTLFLFVSLVGVLMTGCSGCSNERYFCDATGCYRCDGIGCRDVAVPDRPSCFGTYQCEAGEVCTSVGCVGICTGDGDCAPGTVCRTGRCLGPTEPAPTDKPGVCTRNADCPEPPAAICLNGICAVDPVSCGATDCTCSQNSDCDSEHVCSDGRCRPKDESCQFDSQCGAARACVDGQCYAACTPGVILCPNGFSCVDGACVANEPPVGQCTTNANCGANQICLDSSCVPGCATDANCSTGFYCSSGACQPDTRPKPFCTTDAQCLGGSTCVDGVCRSPCNTDMQCQMISGTAPYCRSHFCVTANEANAECITSVDCGGGSAQVCSDGVCE